MCSSSIRGSAAGGLRRIRRSGDRYTGRRFLRRLPAGAGRRASRESRPAGVGGARLAGGRRAARAHGDPHGRAGASARSAITAWASIARRGSWRPVTAGRCCLAGDRSVLGDDELPGTALRDLGEHRLKDLDRPERIFQLVQKACRRLSAAADRGRTDGLYGPRRRARGGRAGAVLLARPVTDD